MPPPVPKNGGVPMPPPGQRTSPPRDVPPFGGGVSGGAPPPPRRQSAPARTPGPTGPAAVVTPAHTGGRRLSFGPTPSSSPTNSEGWATPPTTEVGGGTGGGAAADTGSPQRRSPWMSLDLGAAVVVAQKKELEASDTFIEVAITYVQRQQGQSRPQQRPRRHMLRPSVFSRIYRRAQSQACTHLRIFVRGLGAAERFAGGRTSRSKLFVFVHDHLQTGLLFVADFFVDLVVYDKEPLIQLLSRVDIFLNWNFGQENKI